MSFGKYQFLSWARRGIAKHIIEVDTLGQSGGTADERAKIPISIEINNTPLEKKDFLLRGPGDVTGIKNSMIIRTEPLNGIANYEPNILPYIEFYDEDLPWRYSPSSPAGDNKDHLRPWIALIVLKEGEFEKTSRSKPLPSIKVLNPANLPPHDQLHLWAHMHSNLPFVESQFETFIDNLEENVKEDPDGVYSRLLSPRKLEPNVLYHAYLIPSYETGRLAGLDRPTAGIKAQQAAWPGTDNEFPFYYSWDFRTGENFDFEYLVKLLEPKIMDERVGIRPMDCSKPGFVQADSPEIVSPPEPKIILLEGAMKAPSAKSTVFPPAGVPQPFFDQIQKLVNLNRFQMENLEEDPFVSVPYYGMYHAMRKNLELPGKKEIPEFQADSSIWYNDLNRDPRLRVPAGFGTRVVQANQEKFMDRAWKQLGDVLVEANRKVRFAQFSSNVSKYIYKKTIENRLPEDLVSFTGPLAARILAGTKTVKSAINESLLPKAVFEGSFRRMTRNNTSLSKGLKIANTTDQYNGLVVQMNKINGITTEAKPTFKALNSLSNINSFQAPASVNELKVWSKQSNLEEDFAFNIPNYKGGLPAASLWKSSFDVNIFKTPGTTGGVTSGTTGVITPDTTTVVVTPGTVKPDITLDTTPNVVIRPDVIKPDVITPNVIHSNLNTPAFKPGINKINLNRGIDDITKTSADSASPSIGSVTHGVGSIVPGVGSVATGVGSVTPGVGSVTPAIGLAVLVPNQIRLNTGITEPPLLATAEPAINKLNAISQEAAFKTAFNDVNVRFQFKDTVVQAPTLEMNTLKTQVQNAILPGQSYKKLVDAQIKWPAGMHKVPEEEFLPAMAYPDIPEPAYKYLVDIDKEFLLPNLHLIEPNTLSLLRTNQKFIEAYLMGLNYEMGKELLWREYPTDMRGSYFRQFWDVRGFLTPDTTPKDADSLKDIKPIHTWSNTDELGKHNARDAEGDSEQLVFVIRGDLLKKFPNTVIYAQKAIKGEDANKIIRKDLTPDQYKAEVRFPLYMAELPPDIKLLGFDLKIEEASGEIATNGDNLGWFFVIAQVPGEPNFGMDITFNPDKPNEVTWDDLSWENFGDQKLLFIRSEITPVAKNFFGKNFNTLKTPEWGKSSADMAALLLQKPVMVAIHATEMLNIKVPDINNLQVDKKEYLTLIDHVKLSMLVKPV